MSSFFENLIDSKYHVLILIGGMLVGCLLGYLLYQIVKGTIHRLFSMENSVINQHLQTPFMVLLGFLVSRILLPHLHLNETLFQYSKTTIFVSIILSILWLLFRVLNLTTLIIKNKYDIQGKDNLENRKIHTQFLYLKRIIMFILVIIAFSIILMSFESVKQIGVSILASAGLTGIIIGLAAQKTIGNLLAGFQIAFTQPIRIDDVVIIEGEFGRVEEITLTYVVVKVWDERRIVTPLSYFIEKPFQNWTRQKAELIGAVTLWMDYSFPVQAIRDFLPTVVEKHPLWNGKVANVAIIDSNHEGMQIRILVSADDSGATWDLRCHVREKVIEFIQENHSQHLPKRRISSDIFSS